MSTNYYLVGDGGVTLLRDVRDGSAREVAEIGRAHRWRPDAYGTYWVVVRAHDAAEARRLAEARDAGATDLATEAFVALVRAEERAPVPFVDVCHETAYGTTVRLPFAIRMF